ncbi:DJ-1/PfpI family protein, partial [Turicimonas muris]|uniref:DJ-1/PfpI family protein n=1 Tax=Turicimonas muris TaxID=1796652 RepID=UPI0026771037
MKKLAIVLLMAAAGLSGTAMAADKPSVLVVLASGFEEGEPVEILDVVRCGGFPTDSVSIAGEMVPGAHNITIKADKVLGNDLTQFKNYDMIVLPGGWTGVDNMLSDERLLDLVRHYDQS